MIEPIVDLLDSDNDDYQRFAVLALANMAINIRSNLYYTFYYACIDPESAPFLA